MAAKPMTRWHQAFELLADAPIPTHELDLEGKIVRVNAAGCRLLGLRDDEIIGRHISGNLWRRKSETASRERICRVLANEQPNGGLGAEFFAARRRRPGG